jgi:hypothetical protein
MGFWEAARARRKVGPWWLTAAWRAIVFEACSRSCSF